MESWKSRRDPAGFLIWTHCLCRCHFPRMDRSSCNPLTRLAENLAARPVRARQCASCSAHPTEVQKDHHSLAVDREKVLNKNSQHVVDSPYLDLYSLSGPWPFHLHNVK